MKKRSVLSSPYLIGVGLLGVVLLAGPVGSGFAHRSAPAESPVEPPPSSPIETPTFTPTSTASPTATATKTPTATPKPTLEVKTATPDGGGGGATATPTDSPTTMSEPVGPDNVVITDVAKCTYSYRIKAVDADGLSDVKMIYTFDGSLPIRDTAISKGKYVLSWLLAGI